jgi:GTP-binding protein HflX
MEARDADLLLHVVDASDPEHDRRILQVDEVLEGIGAGAIPQLRIYNKIDRLDRPAELRRDSQDRPGAIWLSAANGSGLGLLREGLQEIFGQSAMRLCLALPPQQGRLRARLFDLGLVQSETAVDDGGSLIVVVAAHQQIEALCREAGVDFLTAVSPCLPAGGFVEFPHETASSAA